MRSPLFKIIIIVALVLIASFFLYPLVEPRDLVLKDLSDTGATVEMRGKWASTRESAAEICFSQDIGPCVFLSLSDSDELMHDNGLSISYHDLNTNDYVDSGDEFRFGTNASPDYPLVPDEEYTFTFMWGGSDYFESKLHFKTLT